MFCNTTKNTHTYIYKYLQHWTSKGSIRGNFYIFISILISSFLFFDALNVEVILKKTNIGTIIY